MSDLPLPDQRNYTELWTVPTEKELAQSRQSRRCTSQSKTPQRSRAEVPTGTQTQTQEVRGGRGEKEVTTSGSPHVGPPNTPWSRRGEQETGPPPESLETSEYASRRESYKSTEKGIVVTVERRRISS